MISTYLSIHTFIYTCAYTHIYTGNKTKLIVKYIKYIICQHSIPKYLLIINPHKLYSSVTYFINFILLKKKPRLCSLLKITEQFCGVRKWMEGIQHLRLWSYYIALCQRKYSSATIRSYLYPGGNVRLTYHLVYLQKITNLKSKVRNIKKCWRDNSLSVLFLKYEFDTERKLWRRHFPDRVETICSFLTGSQQE